MSVLTKLMQSQIVLAKIIIGTRKEINNSKKRHLADLDTTALRNKYYRNQVLH